MNTHAIHKLQKKGYEHHTGSYTIDIHGPLAKPSRYHLIPPLIKAFSASSQ